MNIDPLFITGIAIVLSLGAGYFLRLVTAAKVEHTIRDLLPDDVEKLGVWAAMKAYQYAEQKAKAVVGLSNEGKLALAKQAFEALLAFKEDGNLTDLMKDILIELEVWAQHQVFKPEVAGQ